MLETEKPDLVLAFHPDIFSAYQTGKSGTANMMTIAHAAKVPVYIHDLKRKSKFEGDFENL
jgi:hypothetical protein